MIPLSRLVSAEPFEDISDSLSLELPLRIPLNRITSFYCFGLLFCPQLAILNEEKDVIISENRTLAEENVNKEPEIIERKGRISELSEEGTTLCKSLQEKLAELSE